MTATQRQRLNDKSTAIVKYRSTMYSSDLHHFTETLYLAPDGRLYICTEFVTCGVGRDGIEWVDRRDAIEHVLKCSESVNTDASYTREDAEAMVGGRNGRNGHI